MQEEDSRASDISLRILAKLILIGSSHLDLQNVRAERRYRRKNSQGFLQAAESAQIAAY
jgi:hypothetical protein